MKPVLNLAKPSFTSSANSGAFPRRARRGFVLLTVLWVALVLGVFAAGLSAVAQRDAQGARVGADRLEQELLLQTGLARVVWALRTQGATWPGFRAEGLVLRVPHAGAGGIVARVTPAAGLIDLNTAHESLRHALLRDLVADPGARARIDAAWQARAGRFAAVDDFADLLDALPGDEAEAALSRLRGRATVASGGLMVDFSVAPRAVLQVFPDMRAQANRMLARRAARPRARGFAAGSPVEDRFRVYHVSLAVKTPGGVPTGQGMVLALPPARDGTGPAYFRLDTWPLALSDAVFAHLEEHP